MLPIKDFKDQFLPLRREFPLYWYSLYPFISSVRGLTQSTGIRATCTNGSIVLLQLLNDEDARV